MGRSEARHTHPCAHPHQHPPTDTLTHHSAHRQIYHVDRMWGCWVRICDPITPLYLARQRRSRGGGGWRKGFSLGRGGFTGEGKGRRTLNGRGGVPDAARARLFGDLHGKGVVLSSGFVLSRQAPLRMHLFGTAEGHNGPRAISKIMKWLPIVMCCWLCRVCGKEGVFIQFCGQTVCSD